MVALAALFSLPSAAQTVTITSPICGATWTDWWGKLVRSFFVVAAKCRASLLHGGCVWRRKSWAGADEQRRLLQTVLEKAAWKDGTLETALFEPFEILRHSNQESYRKEKEKTGSGSELGIWLPGMDSNHDSRLQRPLSYH